MESALIYAIKLLFSNLRSLDQNRLEKSDYLLLKIICLCILFANFLMV
jgi:hypothetical protein